MPGHHEQRKLCLGIPKREDHQLALLEPHRLGGSGTADRSVIPSQLGHRMRAFLEPSVVTQSPIVDRIARQDQDFDAPHIQS